MDAILYILLGLSLGTGLTLIALQERFLRERRRLMALGESQRAKADQDQDELNKKWAQECQQHKEELSLCQEQLAKLEALPPPPSPKSHITRQEHEQLIQKKNSELSRLASEIKSTTELMNDHQREINALKSQLADLQGEIARHEESKPLVATELNEKNQQEMVALREQISTLQGEIARHEESQPLAATELNEKNQQEMVALREQISTLQGEIARHEESQPLAAAELNEKNQREMSALREQISTLQREITRLNDLQKSQPPPADDFVLLGSSAGHLIPGSVVRALIKGRQEEILASSANKPQSSPLP